MVQRRWRPEQVSIAIRDGQRRTRDLWAKNPDAKRFLEDWFPRKWERIRTCSMRFKFKEEADGRGLLKRQPYRCNQSPLCIPCAQLEGFLRTTKAMDKFHRCTPGGKLPRFYHIVQTARLTQDGDGWGRVASQDPKWFAGIVLDALKETYGHGIGAYMSYQDFGERGLQKTHPHLDLTLNGWMLQDGQAVRTPRIVLAGGGRKEYEARIIKRALRRDITAWGADVHFFGPVEGVRPYWKLMKYQTREIFDLRKLDYSRENETVWWNDYRNRRRHKMDVHDFLDRYYEMKDRLRGVHLHKWMGHLAPRTAVRTQAKMGGVERSHGTQCTCADCGTWLPYELTDEEHELNQRGRL